MNWKKKAPQPQPATIGRYHSTIGTLPFTLFERAIIDADLSALIISGEVPEPQLLEAFDKILSEYNEALGSLDTASLYLLAKTRELCTLRARRMQTEPIIEILRTLYVPDLEKYLQRLTGLTAKLDPANPVEYAKNLARHEKRAAPSLKERAVEIEMNGLEARLAAREQSAPTREYFTTVFVNLSNHSGTHITKDNTTVQEYCVRVKGLNKAIEQQQQSPKR
ncbi:hypothetical protein [Flaviaesturariibacter amylovorans]|uniref:Uncharacterized protein n=1 Tax=Flaviaesturariibacter amylovorans TaxID=1084520 RepID=A0ABP8GPJ0_9BACT